MSDYTRGLQDALNLAKFAFIGADNNPEREPATQYVYSVDLVEAIENLLEPSGQEVVRYAAEAALRAETPAQRDPVNIADHERKRLAEEICEGEFVDTSIEDFLTNPAAEAGLRDALSRPAEVWYPCGTIASPGAPLRNCPIHGRQCLRAEAPRAKWLAQYGGMCPSCQNSGKASGDVPGPCKYCTTGELTWARAETPAPREPKLTISDLDEILGGYDSAHVTRGTVLQRLNEWLRIRAAGEPEQAK